MAAEYESDTDYESETELLEDDMEVLNELSKKLHKTPQETLKNILKHVHTNRGDLINILTENYKRFSKYRLLDSSLHSKYVSHRDYLSYVRKLYEDDETFGCLERATNSYEAQLYVYNVLQSIYTLLYPKTLSHFSEFVAHVVKYMKHVQHGHICVFDGTHEVLPQSYFENLMVGCFLAISYMKADQCRSERTVIAKMGYHQSSKEYKRLMKQYKKSCSFFDTIDTATFQRNLQNKMGYADDMKSKGGKRNASKYSRRRKRKSVRKTTKKRRTTKRKK